MATIAAPPRMIPGDDRFFFASAVAMALLVLIAFPLQFALGRSTFAAPALVHVHAVAFMGWVAIYVAQAFTGARRATSLHRRLGWIAAGWMALLVVLGTAVTVAMVRRGQSPFFFRPAEFLVFNPLSVVTFAALSAAAIILRRRTGWHRRLHYCGMAMLMGPAFGRILPLPFIIPFAFEVTFAATLLFPLAGIAADVRRSGHVHPAWWWGMAGMFAFALAVELSDMTGVSASLHNAVTAGTPGGTLDPLAYPPPPPGFPVAGR